MKEAVSNGAALMRGPRAGGSTRWWFYAVVVLRAGGSTRWWFHVLVFSCLLRSL